MEDATAARLAAAIEHLADRLDQPQKDAPELAAPARARDDDSPARVDWFAVVGWCALLWIAAVVIAAMRSETPAP